MRPSLKTPSTPTVFNGIRYRSRAEARWAVFFAALGVRAVYEPGKHHLPGGDVYVVDFWLPDAHTYAEVKGAHGFTPAERGRCAALVRLTGRPCLLLAGAPCHQAYERITRDGLVVESALHGLPAAWWTWYDVKAHGVPALADCRAEYVGALASAQRATFGQSRRRSA